MSQIAETESALIGAFDQHPIDGLVAQICLSLGIPGPD